MRARSSQTQRGEQARARSFCPGLFLRALSFLSHTVIKGGRGPDGFGVVGDLYEYHTDTLLISLSPLSKTLDPFTRVNPVFCLGVSRFENFVFCYDT